MNRGLIRKLIFRSFGVYHPERNLLMIPVFNVYRYCSLFWVWFVDYLKFLTIASKDVKPEGPTDCSKETVSSRASRQSWARLIQKVYEIDPLICPKCGHEMRVIAIINDPYEVNKILECLKRNNAPPFDKVVTKVS